MIRIRFESGGRLRMVTSSWRRFYRSGLAWLLLAAAALILAGCQQVAMSPSPAPSTAAATQPATAAPPSATLTPLSPTPAATTAPAPTFTAVVTDAATPGAGPATATPAAAVTSTLAATSTIPVYTYTVVATYPHDPTAFTEGLIYQDGVIYEGTGLRGQSVLEKKDLETGRILQRINLPPQFFGEGVTIFGDKIYQLTWQEFTGFIYDKDTFQALATFTYPTEGWGLTHDGQRLIMSDGTANLYFLDPDTLERIGQVEVRDDRGPVTQINELEYVAGEVYANIWQTDRIARIDPESGKVVGWIDLTALLPPEDRQQRVDVLNGIAYDAGSDRLLVTGKWWPKLFEIDLAPARLAQ